MNTKVVIGIAVVLLGIVGWYMLSQGNEDAMMMEKDADAMMEEGSAMTPEGDAMMDKEEGAMMQKEEGTMMQKGSYQQYAPEKLALAENGKVLLFFHAPWCPICKPLDEEIKAKEAMLGEDVHILKVDFDTATELRKKYGVTIQHTFVQVDPKGNAIAKWSDASTLSQVLARIK